MDLFSFAVGVFVCLLAQVFMMVLLIVAANFGEKKKPTKAVSDPSRWSGPPSSNVDVRRS